MELQPQYFGLGGFSAGVPGGGTLYGWGGICEVTRGRLACIETSQDVSDSRNQGIGPCLFVDCRRIHCIAHILAVLATKSAVLWTSGHDDNSPPCARSLLMLVRDNSTKVRTIIQHPASIQHRIRLQQYHAPHSPPVPSSNAWRLFMVQYFHFVSPSLSKDLIPTVNNQRARSNE